MYDESEFKQYTGSWKRVFAWWPVETVSGQWVWLKRVYRGTYDSIYGQGHEYATLVDLIRMHERKVERNRMWGDRHY